MKNKLSVKYLKVRKNKFGWGVYTTKKIKRGETVTIFDGPIYDDVFDAWTKDLMNHTIQIGPNLWRDSVGPARYINHSCEPNCGIKKYTHIVAMRPIRVGEEITWDYEMTEKNTWWKLRCRCGSKLCRKQIGNYKNMPLTTRKRYSGFISEWLLGKPIKL